VPQSLNAVQDKYNAVAERQSGYCFIQHDPIQDRRSVKSLTTFHRYVWQFIVFGSVFFPDYFPARPSLPKKPAEIAD